MNNEYVEVDDEISFQTISRTHKIPKGDIGMTENIKSSSPFKLKSCHNTPKRPALAQIHSNIISSRNNADTESLISEDTIQPNKYDKKSNELSFSTPRKGYAPALISDNVAAVSNSQRNSTGQKLDRGLTPPLQTNHGPDESLRLSSRHYPLQSATTLQPEKTKTPPVSILRRNNGNFPYESPIEGVLTSPEIRESQRVQVTPFADSSRTVMNLNALMSPEPHLLPQPASESRTAGPLHKSPLHGDVSKTGNSFSTGPLTSATKDSARKGGASPGASLRKSPAGRVGSDLRKRVQKDSCETTKGVAAALDKPVHMLDIDDCMAFLDSLDFDEHFGQPPLAATNTSESVTQPIFATPQKGPKSADNSANKAHSLKRKLLATPEPAPAPVTAHEAVIHQPPMSRTPEQQQQQQNSGEIRVSSPTPRSISADTSVAAPNVSIARPVLSQNARRPLQHRRISVGLSMRSEYDEARHLPKHSQAELEAAVEDAVEAAVRESDRQRAALAKSLDGLTKEQAALRERSSEESRQLSIQSAQIASLVSRIQTLEAELALETRQKDAAIADARDMNEQLAAESLARLRHVEEADARLRHTSATLEREVSRLERELRAEEARGAAAAEERDQVLNDARQQIFDKAKEKVDQVMERYTATKQQLVDARDELSRSARAVAETETRCHELAELLSDRDVRLKLGETRETLLRAALSNLIFASGVGSDSGPVVLPTDITTLSEMVDAAIHRLNMSSRTVTNMTNDVATLKSALKQIETESQDLRQRVRVATLEAAGATREVERLRSVLEDETRLKGALLKEVDDLTKALTAVSMKPSADRQRTGEREAMATELESLHHINEKLQIECRQQRLANKELLDMISELTNLSH